MRKCAFDPCDNPVRGKGLCNGHYLQHRTGRSLKPLQKRARRGEVRKCDTPGCERPHYARGLCNPHWQQSRTGGVRPERDQARLKEQIPCLHCGTPERVSGELFAFCSMACYHRHYRGGEAPERGCVECGDPLDFFALTETGRRRKRTTYRCEGCARTRWCMTRWEIAERDGWVCSIGGEPLDPDIPFPEPGSVTIDHVHPRSLGGEDIPENVRLACWEHNRAKSNRVEFSLIGERP